MKFYDKGFITKFEDYTKVQVLSTGVTILELDIYENQICKDTFKCQSAKSFNEEFLHKSYKNNFLKALFEKEEKETTFRDMQNNILIKIKRDK